MSKIKLEHISKNIDEKGTLYTEKVESCNDDDEIRGWGKRHTQALLGTLIIAMSFVTMVNITIAIVAMTDIKSNNNVEIYDWDKKSQNSIQSIYFLGFVIMMIPSGLIAQKYGWKNITIGCMLLSSILSFTFPIFVRLGGWYAAMVSRFLLGITMSPSFPCTFNMLGKWSPTKERGRNTSFVQSGAQFGRIIMLTISGWLCTISIGWPLIFYTSGVMSGLLALSIAWFGASTPDQHPTISRAELDYILHSEGVTSSDVKMEVPWRKIMTSIPVWACIIAESGLVWQVSTTMTELPAYMNEIYGIELRGNGMLTALPYVPMFIMTFVYSIILEYLIKKKMLSNGQARKWSNTIAMWCSGILLVAFVYTPADNIILGIIFLVLSIAVLAGVNSGVQVTLADMSPNFCGNVKSVQSTLSHTWSTVAPNVNGLIITDMKNINQWRIVFCLSSAVMFITNLVFIIFADNNIQPWNNPKQTKTDVERELLEIKPPSLQN